jgi:electron transport complex protein RnfC
MFWFAQGKEFEKLERHNLFDCIECGACSYACPSHIPLVQYYRASKAEILQLRRDHDKAEQSRMRFEARQLRLDQAESDKEAKRAARKQAAEQRAQVTEAEGGVDPIQAAIDRAKAKKAAQQSGTGQMSELEKLENAVVTTHKRLETAQAKLDEARVQGSDLVEALQTGVDKTRAKLAAAEQALHDYQAANTAVSAARPQVDAAQAAIEKAMAARALDAALSPVEKARADLAKLQQRLQKSQESLARSRHNGDEEKVIEALESSVARLTEKISATQQQLNAAEHT